MIATFAHFVWSFLVAKWADIAGYEVVATGPVVALRANHCVNCPHYHDGSTACRKCGCPIFSKVMLNTERCPVGNWGRAWVKKEGR